MGKDETSTKKRRKLNTTSSSDSSKQAVPVDVYKVCNLFHTLSLYHCLSLWVVFLIQERLQLNTRISMECSFVDRYIYMSIKIPYKSRLRLVKVEVKNTLCEGFI